MPHKNLDSLKKAILAKAQKGMKERVLPIVQKEMVKAVRERVYGVYRPRVYKRRRNEGGLIDTRNMVGNVVEPRNDSFKFKVENVTKASKQPSDYLTPLIVMGQDKAVRSGYPVLYHAGAQMKPYGFPRDFIGATKTNLDKAKMTNALRIHMKK